METRQRQPRPDAVINATVKSSWHERRLRAKGRSGADGAFRPGGHSEWTSPNVHDLRVDRERGLAESSDRWMTDGWLGVRKSPYGCRHRRSWPILGEQVSRPAPARPARAPRGWNLRAGQLPPSTDELLARSMNRAPRRGHRKKNASAISAGLARRPVADPAVHLAQHVVGVFRPLIGNIHIAGLTQAVRTCGASSSASVADESQHRGLGGVRSRRSRDSRPSRWWRPSPAACRSGPRPSAGPRPATAP